YSIGVADSARKQGIARRLIACAEQLAREHHKTEITLEVCEKNEAAVRLYLESGFSLFGSKTGYYEDGCSALLLRKKIMIPAPDN
ncbi:MAG: GNAT family N-acetyltransferase, partial [Desulfofustis sp.]|nr:GNAT family N-acetyltransferase [Desulfofustis sp.]